MSELRYDPIYGQWVAIAQIRGERPNEFRQTESRTPEATCPFCHGQELSTPPALLELSAKDLAGVCQPSNQNSAWITRIVPNKYPALQECPPRPARPQGPFQQQYASGRQEIIIESPRHIVGLGQLNDDELFLMFRAIQLRMAAERQAQQFRYACIFKNCGSEAGASIEHTHTQLVFYSQASTEIADRWLRWERFFHEHQSNLIAKIASWELEQERRIVTVDDACIVHCPFASRFAFQTWVVPKSNTCVFESQPAAKLMAIARTLRATLHRMEAALNSPAYNVLFHMGPLDLDPRTGGEMFGWGIEIVPRLNRFAGYELWGGGWINETPPEHAADVLRSVTVA